MVNPSWLVKRIWPLPWTLFGALIGLIGLASGARALRGRGVLSFYGGACAVFLRHFPLVRGASAITFGHVVLAQTLEDLERAFEHELVHVRQYERWGALFVPAYLAASLWQIMQGRNAYWDNPFEREAYRVAP